MANNLTVPEYAKLKVFWSDKPENYSKENKLKVRNYFSKKYGVDKSSINVIFRAVKPGKNGEMVEITGAGIDNIMDKNYQAQLMKEWYTRNDKKVDFDRLIALDKKVNGSLNSDFDMGHHRSWNLKWLFIDNFLCFGDENFVSFGKLGGLNIVNSIPENQGGKTTFSVDAIKFLLYGKTTKTDKNAQIFNTYRDKNSLTVRGLLEIEGEEIILERNLKRTPKRAGGYNVTNQVNYYKLLPDGEEEKLEEADAKQTTELIKNTIGSEKDFDLTILATARTLEDLIDAKPTESGRLLTKFIGLEVIETKEAIAKKMNSEFNKTKKGNMYNITTLLETNTTLAQNLINYTSTLETNECSLSKSEEKLKEHEAKKDKLFNSKLNVDELVSNLNPDNLGKDIESITEQGIGFKNKIGEYKKQIEKLSSAKYDEDEYHKLTDLINKTTISIGTTESEIKVTGTLIENLVKGGVCQACKKPLDDVDNGPLIASNKLKVKTLESKLSKAKLLLENNTISLDKIKVSRELVDARNRLELEIDKAEVEIGSLRNKIKSKKLDLSKYKANEVAIKHNMNVDGDISAVKTNIVVENRAKTDIEQIIFTAKKNIKDDNQKVVDNLVIIETLKKEEEIEKIFKVYLEMVGKNGISKLVLRSVLPIINSELQRLLDDVCDFDVELTINARNEVEYVIINDGVEKLLKSGSGLELTIASIGLRCVLGKVSHLPMPNFITFDEVLGRVAAINVEKVKPMFEKVKSMYDIVFFITHDDSVKDWGDNVITVKKINHVSTISIK